MKKIMALLLVAVMSIALVACDASNQTSNDNESVNGQTSTAETEPSTTGIESQPTNSTEAQPTVEPTPEPEESSAPAFDTSWAENDLQKLIPQPPFSGWTVTKSTDTVCEMECATGVTDTAVFYPTCEDYVDTLNSCGFVETDKSKDYFYEALDAKGNKVEFKYGDCWCWITITAAE